MTFEYPGFFLLVLIIPLMIVGAILAARARGQQWRRLVAERLRPILVRERPRARRWVSFAVLLLGFALLIAALAAPNAGYRETSETIRGRNILLAVDVSRSMLAEDESPSRLAAARAAALELLDRFPNDRVGVIAFSGVAWLQAPLTIDHDALREAFQQLEFQSAGSEWIPRGGSDLANAVRLAIQTFRETGQRNNALIILSDGEAHTGDVEGAADDAEESGLTIFTAGFGTDDGDFIPDPGARDGKLHDRSGNLVLTRLQSEPLDLLARRTGGFYTKGSGRHFITNLEIAVQRLDQYELEGRNRRIAIPRFQWFLAPAMLLFVVGMILNTSWRFKAAPATALLTALLVLAPGAPSDGGIIPRTKAERALADGDHHLALALFEDEVAGARGERKARLQLGEAAAAYRLGDFRRASRAYSGALLSRVGKVQEQAHFGLGNTQFFKGLSLLEEDPSENTTAPPSAQATILYWRDSIAHFDGALELNPHNQRARENRDRVAKRLDELLKEEEEKKQAALLDPKGSGEDPTPPEQNPDIPDPGSPDQPPPRNGEGDPPDQPKPPTPPDQPGDPKQGDPSQPENPGAKPPPANLNPKPGETPEEYARRILNENADFEGRPVPLRFRHLSRPAKDW